MNSKEYWEDRENEALQHYIKQEKEYDKRIKQIYENMLESVQGEIDRFYRRYADKEGLTLAEAKKRVSKMDIAEYERKAKRYVDEKDFSKRANEEMRLYNLTMKVNRLEMLKANIGLHLISGNEELERFMAEILQGRTEEELKRQAGILGNSIQNNAQTAHAIVNASFHNATFSERVWMNQNLMKADLDKLLQTGLIQGKNPRVLAKELRQYFVGNGKKDGKKGAKYRSETLMRTELARVQTEAQKQSFERNGFSEYTFHANGGCCDACRGKDGKHFKVKDMQPGENASPMHPNCRCSASAYEDSEEYEAWLDYLSKGGSTEEWSKLKNNKSSSKGVSSGNKGKEKSNYPELEKIIDFNDKTAIINTLNKFEKTAVQLPYETLCVVTSDGKVWKMEGSTGFVEESLIQSQKGGSSLENAYSYHNHPKNETNFSFSGEDVGFFLEYKEAYSKASDYKYSYIMKRTKDTLAATYDEITSEFEEIRGKEVLEKAFLDGFDMDEDGYHETMNILSKKYGFYYERKLK